MLADKILSFSKENKEKKVKTISFENIFKLSQSYQKPLIEIEKTSLKNNIIPLRYLKNFQSINLKKQLQLLNSNISLVGLGGLGGCIIETLARIGVRKIKVADNDFFEESNLNRQALSTMDNIGFSKIDIAQKKIAKINPSIIFEAENKFIDKNNIDDFLKDTDILIDALGGLETRQILQTAASKNNIPLLTGAIAGWSGYVSLVMPQKKGPANFMNKTDAKNDAEKTLGSLAPLANLVASIMSAQLISVLCKEKTSLKNKMLIIDLKNLFFEIINF